MASSSQPFGTTAGVEDFDMNDYFNFDQGFHTSPSPTNAKLEPQRSLDPRQLMLQHPQPPRQQYNGPSHNYDQFKQQTGLPTGAISHMNAVNQFSNSNHIKPTNFGAAHFGGYNPGFNLGDCDAQGSNDSQTYFDANNDDFAIDPSAIDSEQQPSTAFRVWPGMHSEQAKQQAQAEVDAKQQSHDEAMRSQQHLPTNFEDTYGGRSRSQTTSEPQVNEQISKLLNQMRQNSNASIDDDEEARLNMSGAHSISHAKKAEEDMDEDERLLASEEGKKLSSKERRQLRNKVSARAFRSRRKEYITQLEGEVAAKASECNDMKMTNRHLLEQNRQLTQLCKTMLNHPAFGTFMEDMSNDPSLLNAFAPQQSSQPASQPTTTHAPQEPAMQAQPQQSQQSQQQPVTHVGMSMVPETNLDFSMLNLGGNHWGSNYPQQQQIFAVHDLPIGPSFEELESSALSGKAVKEDCTPEEKPIAPIANDVSSVPSFNANVKPVSDIDDISDIKDDPSFALYLDTTKASSDNSGVSLKTTLDELEQSLPCKPTSFSLSLINPGDESAKLDSVDRLFASVGAAMRRIEGATCHLPL